MSHAPRFLTIDSQTYFLRVERKITHSQRSVLATAFDASGAHAATQEMSTTAARGYLDRDTGEAPPAWEELEAIAVDLLRVQLEE